MQRSTLAAAFGLDGSFNDVSLRLTPGASESATIEALHRILLPYGGAGALGRSKQLSNRILQAELDQLGVLAGMIPVVFLGVAAFLINMVLGRLISLQRSEIAALKAVGYSNREVGLHYLGLRCRGNGTGRDPRGRGGARTRPTRAGLLWRSVPISRSRFSTILGARKVLRFW